MDYYSVIKKNKPTLSAATWMDLEIIILSEVSQKEEDKCHMVLLTHSVYLRAQSTYALTQSTYALSLLTCSATQSCLTLCIQAPLSM